MKKETKKEEKLFVVGNMEEEYYSEPLTEKQVIERANEQRNCYIQDGVDPDFIKEAFPNEIKDMKEAHDWLRDVGEVIYEVPPKPSEGARVLQKLFKDNGTIKGTLKFKGNRDECYRNDEQGTWKFTVKVLDIDENMNTRLQIVSDKVCPSGAWDNGIRVVQHSLINLHCIQKSFEDTVHNIIKTFFRSNKGLGGRNYKVENYYV